MVPRRLRQRLHPTSKFIFFFLSLSLPPQETMQETIMVTHIHKEEEESACVLCLMEITTAYYQIEEKKGQEKTPKTHFHLIKLSMEKKFFFFFFFLLGGNLFFFCCSNPSRLTLE
jgi:hypothetical protein